MQGRCEQKKNNTATKQKSLLRTVLYMTKKQLPDLEFHSLVDLRKAKGCTSLLDWPNPHAPFFYNWNESKSCVSCNGTTDKQYWTVPLSVLWSMKLNITVHKLLIIFVRIVKNGSPWTLFVGNYMVTLSITECVFYKVQEVLHARGIDYRKIIRFCLDGRSTCHAWQREWSRCSVCSCFTLSDVYSLCCT